ncbi:MAG: hypothetical protein HGB03_00175 [Candidatus Yonathbacteria bacterium]|nr:hypothetical protein [Candidatus Yonathbacteria bacterium]NTW48096.1 hypothetical protein [Candidatus Yonathbacteria bacterium]
MTTEQTALPKSNSDCHPIAQAIVLSSSSAPTRLTTVAVYVIIIKLFYYQL